MKAEIIFTILSIASEKTASELVRCHAISFPMNKMTPIMATFLWKVNFCLFLLMVATSMYLILKV
jgi:hypothetical protein